MSNLGTRDFFISYNGADSVWAAWIAWVLEEKGYSVIIQAWDFRPGSNFILDMQRATTEAQRIVMLLSENYLKALYTQPEWAAAFNQDPTSSERKLLPIRISSCTPTGLLASLVYVDLVGKTEIEAEKLLLAALQERAKPSSRPAFPKDNSNAERINLTAARFPGFPTSNPKSPEHLAFENPSLIRSTTGQPSLGQSLNSCPEDHLQSTTNQAQQDAIRKYRVEVEKILYEDYGDNNREIHPVSLKALDELKKSLKIPSETAALIENEVFQTCLDYEGKIDKYRQLLTDKFCENNTLNSQDCKKLKHFQRALGLDDESVILAYIGLGNDLYKQGSLQEACSVFEQAIILNPNIAAPYVNLGAILCRQGKTIKGKKKILFARDLYEREGNDEQVKQLNVFLDREKNSKSLLRFWASIFSGIDR